MSEENTEKMELIAAWHRVYSKLSTATVSGVEYFQERLKTAHSWEIRQDIEYMNARLEKEAA